MAHAPTDSSAESSLVLKTNVELAIAEKKKKKRRTPGRHDSAMHGPWRRLTKSFNEQSRLLKRKQRMVPTKPLSLPPKHAVNPAKKSHTSFSTDPLTHWAKHYSPDE